MCIPFQTRAVKRFCKTTDQRVTLIEPGSPASQSASHSRGQPAPVGLVLPREMPSITRKEIVPAGAGEQYFDPMPARQFADVQDVERRRIGERLIELHDHALEVVRHAPGL